jgi:hypothetical protein
MSTSYSNSSGTGDRSQLILVTVTSSLRNGLITGAATNLEGCAGLDLRLVNGTSASDWWFAAAAVSGNEIKFYFGPSGRVIDEIRLVQSTTATHGVWDIQGSNDGSSWTTLSSSITLGGATTSTYSYSNTTSYTYYRFLGVSGNANNNPFIYEFEFKIDDTPAVDWSRSGGVGDRTAIITVTKSSDLSFTGTLSELVKGNFVQAEFFASAVCAGKWLKFDLGSGNAKVITECRFYSLGTISSNHGVWKFQGSNDDSSWTDIGSSFTWTIISGVNQVFTFTQLNGNTVEYRYYRLLGVSGSTSSNPWLYEFNFAIGSAVVVLTLSKNDTINNLLDGINVSLVGAANFGVIVSDRNSSLVDAISLVGPPPDYKFLTGDSLSNIQDSTRSALGIVQLFSDSVNNLVDTFSKLFRIPIAVFDSQQFNWADAISSSIGVPLTLTKSDSVNNFVDAATALKKDVIISITKSDTINLLADAIRIYAILRATAGDNVVISDSVMMRFVNLLRIGELLPDKLDFVSLLRTAKPAFSDSVNSLSDAVSIALKVTLSLSKGDTLNLTDAVTVALSSAYSQSAVDRIRRYLGDTQSS